MNAETTTPVSILIAALGGEGGGVLSNWLVESAMAAGFPVQSTSIPGVAQRTGATTYYLEIFPVPINELGDREPVLISTFFVGPLYNHPTNACLRAIRFNILSYF